MANSQVPSVKQYIRPIQFEIWFVS